MKILCVSAALLVSVGLHAQAPAGTQAVARPARPRTGGFVPGQQRPAGDPVQIERGNKVYGISCRGCHGADLRGGDMGGPNLLRSQAALSDREGEMIVPIIQGSLQGMPAIRMSPEDARAVAAYVRSVLGTIGVQGMPPEVGQAPPSVLVGDAAKGKASFAATCGSCHSATGDLKGIATRIPDAKTLQNTWIAGGMRAGRGAPRSRGVTAAITQGSERFEGRLVRIDDFLVTIELADGTSRTFSRDGETPKVEVHDPLEPHRKLLASYSDDDMHNVTAYLATLK